MQNYILSLLLLFGFSLHGQADTLAFPASWAGKYAGELEVYNAKGLQQKLPMELHILPIDTSENYTWYIIYGEDKEAGLRAYELVTVDAEKGLYKIDEKNSIMMEGYLIADKFIQTFEVQSSLLVTTTEKTKEDEIVWEILFGGFEPVSTTGNQKVDGEDIPPVQAFPMKGVQRAVLKRM